MLASFLQAIDVSSVGEKRRYTMLNASFLTAQWRKVRTRNAQIEKGNQEGVGALT